MFGAQIFADALGQYIKAGSQSCSPEVLEQLAKSDIDRIRLRVAENPNTPASALKALSQDRCPDVRIAVGINPSTHTEVRQMLAQDEDLTVRLGLAEDINSPLSILDILAQDSNPYVACKAEQTKAIILSHIERSGSGEQTFVNWVRQGFDQGRQSRYA